MYRSNTEMRSLKTESSPVLRGFVSGLCSFIHRISAVCTRSSRRLDIIIVKFNPGWLFVSLKIRSVRMMTKKWGLLKAKQKKELSHRCSIPFQRQPER